MKTRKCWTSPALALVATVALLGAAACGGSGEESGSGGGAALESPVTVEHAFGETEVSTVPERIVTVDMQWTDVMLAMDVEPVGYTVDPLMPESGAPWQELSDDAEQLSAEDGLPLEKIAELDPDLILGMYSITDEDTYTLLSEMAPTIATPVGHEVTPWQDLMGIAGDLLDAPDTAEEVTESVEGEVRAAADDLPGLQDQTFALAQYVVGDSMYIVSDEEDGSSLFFQQLGMALLPEVVSEGEESGETRVNVSTERADLLEADFLVFYVNGGDENDLADIPGFEELPGTVAIQEYPVTAGLNTPSPLSIPYVLGELRPHLETAAGEEP